MNKFHNLKEKVTITEVYHDKSFTMVKVTLEDYQNIKYIGIGFSKCNPIDTYNRQRGKEIALGRALKNLYEHYNSINILSEETDTPTNLLVASPLT